MDKYSRKFKREEINNAHDLMWFGKLENSRYYPCKNKEVVDRLGKRGERKESEQMYIQINVSRKDASNKIKLSPMKIRGVQINSTLKSLGS
jgi:hypothetical protein